MLHLIMRRMADEKLYDFERYIFQKFYDFERYIFLGLPIFKKKIWKISVMQIEFWKSWFGFEFVVKKGFLYQVGERFEKLTLTLRVGLPNFEEKSQNIGNANRIL